MAMSTHIPSLLAGKPAVFLDKDGTLLVDVPFNVDPDRMVLAERACHALHALGKLDVPLVVVSNQPGVAQGRFHEEALCAVGQRLDTFFRYSGARLAGFYYCPHHPEGTRDEYAIRCNCRKPRSGLLQRAAADLGVALEHSWMVGDILDDIEAGNRAGCTTILIDNGNETEWLSGPLRSPHFTFANIGEAAALIADTLSAYRLDAPSEAWLERTAAALRHHAETNHVAME
ncbi:MAG: D-glycero-D-manno-heptose,7-bisphosphate 7-phosphatase 3 [Rhodocyclales bacterium]|nr:D-glycero-D-manno-heptose,7-bisphosphate 7-phosphatase 3 [Rhodocyclales bacterium]